MAFSTEWILPILNAIALDVLLPERYFLKFLIIVGTSFSAFLEAMEWFLAGYIDAVYLGDDHRRSYTRVMVFMATLVVLRVLLLSWYLNRMLILTVWDHVALLLALTLCLAVSWQFLCVGRQKKISILWHKIELLALSIPFNLVYSMVVVVGVVLKQTSSARRALADILLPTPVTFSYSTAPEFDPRTQIRLLKLHRGRPFFGVSAELTSCDITDVTVYHAISYAWSHSLQEDRTITLNGMNFSVKRNVYDILRRCSSLHQPQLIWIDSICIDQTSLMEKTFQVRRIQEIYASASHVIVCLGNGPAHLALGLILELEGVRRYFGEAYLTRHVAGFLERQRTDIYLRARVKALHELLRHPWFRRVWVVQEVIVARKVTMCYGRQSIPLPEFYERLDILSAPMVSLLALFNLDTENLHVASAELGITSMPFIIAYRKKLKRQGPQRISHLLRSFSDREATVPIGKVFALVGMAKRYSPDPKQLIDYQDTTPDAILLDLANLLLDNNEALDVLDLAGVGLYRQNPNLPSWTVDWTIKRSSMSLHRTFSSPAISYCATGTKPPKIYRGKSHREIVVRGQFLDRIHSIAPIHDLDTSNESLMKTLWTYPSTALSLARTHLPNPYPTSQPLDEAVWRTLIGDKTHTQHPAPSYYGQILTSHCCFMRDTQRISQSRAPMAFATDAVRQAFLERWGEERVERAQRENVAFQNIDLLYDSSRGAEVLVFCVTEKGYVEMVPRLSEVGDGVALVYGMHVPCVVRAYGQKWRLVGGAYVYGVMDGEGLEFGYEEEEITLV